MRSHHRKRKYCIEALERRQLLSLTVPALSSLPGSTHKLFLDFDGNAAFTWNNDDGHGDYAVHGAGTTSTAIPAYNVDADPNNFSDGELTEINQIWAWVAEKYSPFNVNVTTVDPGNRSDNVTVQVIMSGSNSDWYDSKAGGVAAIGGFASSTLPNTCFAFGGNCIVDSKGNVFTSARRVQAMGETAAHEAGHEFGLVHERSQPTGQPIDTYYDGTSTTVPIMGGSSNNTNTGVRGIWWMTDMDGKQFSPDTVQNEITTLTGSSGPGQRGDDHGAATPQPLTITLDGRVLPSSGTGIIEQSSDIDDFSFNATGNRATFTITNATYGAMLKPQIRLIRQSTGAAVAVTTTTTNNSCSIDTTAMIPGQTYLVRVDGFSQYGSLGQYTINGSIQQFATYDSDSRFVNIGGFSGNNTLTLSVISDPSFPSGPGLLLVSDGLNGGAPATQTFSMSGLNLIFIYFGNGDDKVTVNPMHGLNGSSFHPGVRFYASGGSDTLVMSKGSDTAADFHVNSTVQISMGITDAVFYDTERVELRGNNTATYFFVHEWQYVAPLYLYGGSAADLFYCDPDVTGQGGSHITIDGAGGSDIFTFDASTVTGSKSFNVFDTLITTGTFDGQRDFDFDNIESLNVYGTAVDDGMTIYTLAAITTLSFHGGNGNDNLTLGDSYDGLDVSDVLGVVYFYGDGGTDSGYVDDVAATSAHTYIVDHNRVGTTTSGNIFNAGGVEYLTIGGSGSVGCAYYVYEGQGGVGLGLIGGAAGDSFTFDAGEYWNATVTGGGGVDAMAVDDRSSGNPFTRVDIGYIAIARYIGVTPYVITYSGIESPAYYGSSITNTVNIYSTSAEIPAGYQWTVILGSGNDNVTLYPHTGGTTSTILGGIGIGGGYGSDTITIDDSATTVGVGYIFYNPYGPSTCDIAGLGPALVGIGNDFETVNLNAGSNNDTFRIDSYKTGGTLNINGNNGADTVDFTPISQSVTLNITSLAAFSFIGGSGADMMRFFNANDTGVFNYTQSSTALLASSIGWSLSMANSGVEIDYVAGDFLAENFTINSMPAGTTFQMSGGGGLDSVIANVGPVEIITADDLGSLTIANGASVKFPSTTHVGVIDRGTFTMNGTAKLDLYRNDLAVDYTVGNSPIGTWNGSAYTGMTALVRTGRNGGSWNATSGITTSGATGSLTAIGIAEASQALGLSGSQTKTFDGYTVDASTVLVKFTYAGDANLDGKINVDDYIKIDGGISSNLKGWFNGDFNYDGKINIDDYTLIDNNIRIQGPPMLSASSPDAIGAPKLIWSDAARDESADLLDL